VNILLFLTAKAQKAKKRGFGHKKHIRPQPNESVGVPNDSFVVPNGSFVVPPGSKPEAKTVSFTVPAEKRPEKADGVQCRGSDK
jgi:hypothetical protein